jgi:glyoxalase superfamily protein
VTHTRGTNTRATEYAVPTLPSRDLHETLRFLELLGFANAGDAPDVWHYMIVRRGSVELHFYESEDEPPSRCFVWVDDVDELHSQWASHGVQLDVPADTPFGVRRLTVVEPSGNRIEFGTGPH